MVCIELRIATAGVHVVNVSIRGAAVTTTVAVTVVPGPCRVSASTAHDLVEGEVTGRFRCIAGVARRLRLVGRDAVGNATPVSATKWHAALRSTLEDSTHKLGFSSSICAADDSSVASALLTYSVELPGIHELWLRLNGGKIAHAPFALTVLPPAWGPALRGVTAGLAGSLYVRVRPEGEATVGSAAGRRLVHAVQVDAYERRTHEAARVTARQVHHGAAYAALRAADEHAADESVQAAWWAVQPVSSDDETGEIVEEIGRASCRERV